MPWTQIEATLAPVFARQAKSGQSVAGENLLGSTLAVANSAWLGQATPPSARGHTNRSRSRRFIGKQMRSPLHHSLGQIAAIALEHEFVAAEQILPPYGLYLGGQAAKPRAHVGHAAASQIFVRLGRQIILPIPTCCAACGDAGRMAGYEERQKDVQARWTKKHDAGGAYWRN